MQTIDTTLRFARGRFRMKSVLEEGTRPTPFVPEAKTLADHYAQIVNGKPSVLLTENAIRSPYNRPYSRRSRDGQGQGGRCDR